MLLTKSGFKLQQGCPCFKKHKYTMLFPLRMSLNTATNCSSLVVVVGKGTSFHSNKWQQNNMTGSHLMELQLVPKYFYFYWIFKCKNVCIHQYLLCNSSSHLIVQKIYLYVIIYTIKGLKHGEDQFCPSAVCKYSGFICGVPFLRNNELSGIKECSKFRNASFKYEDV